MDPNIKGKLEAILAEQMARLIASGSINNKGAEDIMKRLRTERLMPDQIELDICIELKKTCMIKMEEAITTSTRFGGLGWSEGHIKDHMKRCMKEKMDAFASIIRQETLSL
jgi:hypothetical protein